MPDYNVTFSAVWVDRHGVKWTSGKKTRTMNAESRAAAVIAVRGSWPEGAEGECKAEPVDHVMLERVKSNLAAGKPPSTWDKAFTWLQEWPTLEWLRQ
jgi:hypothetical protein